jgi:hypothetical protein
MAASAQQTNYRVSPNGSARQRPGLLDFALKSINPSDQNYGQCIDEGRRMLLEETIENAYFWSNIISITLLAAFLLVMLYQQKLKRRRELIVAGSLAQYQNALVRADIRIDEATKRNHALMEALTSNMELAATESALASGSDATGSKKLVSKKRIVVESSAPGTVTSSPAEQGAKGSSAAKQTDLSPRSAPPKNGEIDLVSKVNLMQQQISLLQEREKQLRRQLNDAELRLQKEQEKNRSLKDN